MIAPMIFMPSANAGNDSEQVQQAVSGPAMKESNWSLRLPQDEQVAYRGVVSFDSAGMGTGSMMYPAPTPGGFLAAVITHGILVESSKASQKQKLQDEADKVLSPYQAILSSYKYKDLMQRALDKVSAGGNKKLIEFSDKPGTDWLIESAPVFSMTQDQSAMILDNVVLIYPPNASTATYQNTIRVVAHAKTGTDLVGAWTENQGETLKEESVNLLTESLNIALGEIAGKPDENSNPHKTFRYLEGNTERMERAQLISERCNRVVIKTLRGWLMSVPSRRGTATDAADQCIQTASSSK